MTDIMSEVDFLATAKPAARPSGLLWWQNQIDSEGDDNA